MFKVMIVSGPDRHEISIPGEVAVVGRAADCEIKITDLKSSRNHCRIERIGGAWRLNDLETPNKTIVNGRAVSVADLRPGDEIQIGDTTITVIECDVPSSSAETIAAPAIAAPIAPPPPPAVPLDRKLELKQKIEDAKARHLPKRGGPLKTLAVLVVASAAAVAILIGLKALDANRGPGPGAGPGRHAEPLDEARRALAALQKEAEGPVSADLIARVTSASAKWNEAWAAGSRDKTAMTPFDQLAASLLLRRAEQFNARFSATRASVEEHLKHRRYAMAVEELKKFRAGADSTFEEAIRDLVAGVDAAVEKDFAAVQAQGAALEQMGRFTEAGRYYASQASRFAGTTFHARIADKPESLAAVAKATEAAAERRRAEELARAEALKRQVSLPQPAATGAPSAPGEPPKPVEVKLPAFMAKVLEAAVAGKLAGRPQTWTPQVTGPATTATTAGLSVNGGVVPWSAADPAALVRAAGEAFAPEDLPLAAEFAYAMGLGPDADRLLAKFLSSGDKKARQSQVDALLARARGLAGVPEGGYTWDAKAGWEDRPQRANRLAFDDAAKHLKAFLGTSSAKTRDAEFQKLLAIYNDPVLAPEVREKVRAEAVSKLLEWKKKNVGDIAKKAKASAGMVSLRNLKLELNRRREAALKVIYDPKIYLPEDDPRWGQGDKINGQDEVDRLVKEVQKLWDEPSKIAFEGSTSIKRDLEELRAVNDTYLAALGETVDTEAELKEFEEVMANLNSVIDIRTYCLNGKESELLSWGRRADRYNESMTDPAVGADEKGHVKVVNDYRDMMGRRRVFLDARLCRATKKHSAECDKAGRIWHVGSDGDPQSRARAEGFSAGVAENVAMGYSSPRETWWSGWYRASDHHRNGLNEAHNCMGYGYVGRTATQNFSNIGPPRGF